MKLAITIASADALPTATWLGSIKKNIAAATSTAPKVIIAKSLIEFISFEFFIAILTFFGTKIIHHYYNTQLYGNQGGFGI